MPRQLTIKEYETAQLVAKSEDTGMLDPMTTRGDIIYKNSSNETTRLPVGSAGTVLKSDGTDLSWQNESGLVDPMTTRGDIIVRDSSNNTNRLGLGSSGQVLKSNGSDITWSDIVGGGDILYEGSTTANQVISIPAGYKRFDIYCKGGNLVINELADSHYYTSVLNTGSTTYGTNVGFFLTGVAGNTRTQLFQFDNDLRIWSDEFSSSGQNYKTQSGYVANVTEVSSLKFVSAQSNLKIIGYLN